MFPQRNFRLWWLYTDEVSQSFTNYTHSTHTLIEKEEEKTLPDSLDKVSITQIPYPGKTVKEK